jgi:hypothetical protein
VKYFVQICMLGRCVSNCRDCGVYFKRMRAAGEFEEAKEDFEEFISAQKLEW